MDNNSRRSLIDKVNSEGYTSKPIINEDMRRQYNSTQNNNSNMNNSGMGNGGMGNGGGPRPTNPKGPKKPKQPKGNIFQRIKNSKILSKYYATFISSKHIEPKSMRYLDRFCKVCFNIGFLGLVTFLVLIITSPNQFTKELIYRPNDTLVFDNKKKLVGKISQKREHGEHVENIKYDDLNQGLINSLVGTEDSSFFNHNGLDVVNTVEGAASSLVGTKKGGSSITQQIIGQTHVGRLGNSSVSRKAREIYLSLIAETQLTKSQILESYFNYFDFGQNNIKGVELASKFFYDTPASNMDYVQSTILVGTLNAPTSYNPLGGYIDGVGHVNYSQKRLENVLLANKNQGYLSDKEYFLLQQTKIEDTVKINRATTSNKYQDFIDVVAQEMQEKYDIDPFVESLKVYTTMDRKTQYHAAQLTNKKHVQVPNNKLNFGFVLSKTQTGEIVALSGGNQYRKDGAYLYNNAVDNKQQPGSAFKPIIDYSPTFEFLHWSDRTPISNAPYTYPGTNTQVRNVDGTSGGILTMDSAIASSRNLTALRAMEAVYNKVGMDGLTEYLNKLGFEFEKGEVVPAYGLGGLKTGVTPKQMNGAYQAFGNGGKYIEPYTVLSYETEDGKVSEAKHEATQAIDEKTAFMTATTLERSTKLPGAYISTANYNSSPYAAKTGTSNWDESGAKYGIPNLSPKDTWYTGFTSEYTMSSWGGYDPKDIKKGYYPGFNDGSHDYSAKLWGNMMSFVSNGKEKSYLDMKPPEGIVKASFNSRVEPPFKKGSASAYFYSDNLPTGYAAIKEKEDNDDDNEKDLNVSLSAGGGSVSAKFGEVDGYTPVLVVGGENASGSSSMSLAANDYDQVFAYYTKGNQQYAGVSACYFNGKLYKKCPAKPDENDNGNGNNNNNDNNGNNNNNNSNNRTQGSALNNTNSNYLISTEAYLNEILSRYIFN